jgi:hypothetical protein
MAAPQAPDRGEIVISLLLHRGKILNIRMSLTVARSMVNSVEQLLQRTDKETQP